MTKDPIIETLELLTEIADDTAAYALCDAFPSSEDYAVSNAMNSFASKLRSAATDIRRQQESQI